MGQKQKSIYRTKSDRTRQKNKRGDNYVTNVVVSRVFFNVPVADQFGEGTSLRAAHDLRDSSRLCHL